MDLRIIDIHIRSLGFDTFLVIVLYIPFGLFNAILERHHLVTKSFLVSVPEKKKFILLFVYMLWNI